MTQPTFKCERCEDFQYYYDNDVNTGDLIVMNCDQCSRGGQITELTDEQKDYIEMMNDIIDGTISFVREDD